MSDYIRDDEALLEGTVTEEITEEEKKPPKEEQEYYDLPDSPDARRRGWSVISLFAAVLSVLLCPFYYVSLVFAAVAIVGAVISRRTLGYFDGLSVAGLLVGLVGAVFGVFSLIIDVTGVLDALK